MKLRLGLSNTAGLVRASAAETLTYYGFSQEHGHCIRTNMGSA